MSLFSVAAFGAAFALALLLAARLPFFRDAAKDLARLAAPIGWKLLAIGKFVFKRITNTKFVSALTAVSGGAYGALNTGGPTQQALILLTIAGAFFYPTFEEQPANETLADIEAEMRGRSRVDAPSAFSR